MGCGCNGGLPAEIKPYNAESEAADAGADFASVSDAPKGGPAPAGFWQRVAGAAAAAQVQPEPKPIDTEAAPVALPQAGFWQRLGGGTAGESETAESVAPPAASSAGWLAVLAELQARKAAGLLDAAPAAAAESEALAHKAGGWLDKWRKAAGGNAGKPASNPADPAAPTLTPLAEIPIGKVPIHMRDAAGQIVSTAIASPAAAAKLYGKGALTPQEYAELGSAMLPAALEVYMAAITGRMGAAGGWAGAWAHEVCRIGIGSAWKDGMPIGARIDLANAVWSGTGRPYAHQLGSV